MGTRVLLIGGTGFIGDHVLAACRAHGHEVTLFNRDRRRVPDGLACIVGDRRRPTPAARAALAAGWDAVIDTCAYTATDIAISRSIPTRRYLLLSTCGVYRSTGCPQIIDERAPVDTRGAAAGKLDCERTVTALQAESLVVRLGLVTGPGDPTGRLAYWIERCLGGGDVLVPVDPDQPVQMVDVRDVAVFLASAVESELRGVINIAGTVTTFAELVRLIMAVASVTPTLRWLPEKVAMSHGVQPWREVPLWLPADHPYRAHMRTGTERAARAGFALRPLTATLHDVIAWYRTHRRWQPDWLPLERERAILARIR
jgi:2'-hydroxyisoflavone reductase